MGEKPKVISDVPCVVRHVPQIARLSDLVEIKHRPRKEKLENELKYLTEAIHDVRHQLHQLHQSQQEADQTSTAVIIDTCLAEMQTKPGDIIDLERYGIWFVTNTKPRIVPIQMKSPDTFIVPLAATQVFRNAIRSYGRMRPSLHDLGIYKLQLSPKDEFFHELGFHRLPDDAHHILIVETSEQGLKAGRPPLYGIEYLAIQDDDGDTEEYLLVDEHDRKLLRSLYG